MYGSAYITAHYLSSQHPQIQKVRVVGMDSICYELARVGIECVGGEQEQIQHQNIDDFFAMEVDCTVGAVVVGLDTKFTYKKLAMAALQIQSGKAKFFATNDDAYDMVGGKRSPGAGAMVTAIQCSLNSTDGQSHLPLVIGKPNPFAWELIKKDHNLNNCKALMLGDRMDTDILVGFQAGIDTCLVMSGCTEN